MGTIRVVNFVSLDGVVQSVLSADEDRDGGFEAGGWVSERMDDEVARIMSDATTGAAAMLLGRRTYQGFAAIWPTADDSQPAVAAMNRMPKYVVSRTLAAADWQHTSVVADIADLDRIKQETDGVIAVFGSSRLLPSLFARRLVDEIWLLVFPLVIGAGKKMFGDGSPALSLELTGSAQTPSGVVVQRYRLLDS